MIPATRQFPALPRRPLHPRPRRSAFTFTEVLFAVMILGIGFILIAAVLPVAIQQNRINVDEATARNVALAALAELQAAAKDTDLPVTGASPAPNRVATLLNFRGSRVSTADPRFQWSVVYNRESGSPPSTAASIYIIVQRTPREILGRREYLPVWLKGGNSEPQRVAVNLKAPAGSKGSLIEFTDDQGKAAAASGTYVIVENSAIPSGFRLSYEDSPNTWAVDPSSPAIAGDLTTDAYIIGRALQDPTQPWSAGSNDYVGPAQDIYLLHDTINVNP